MNKGYSMTDYDNESHDKSVIEDAPTLDDNRTIEGENLASVGTSSGKESVSPPAPSLNVPVQDQPTVAIASSPSRPRKVRNIVLYVVFLLIGIALGVVGMLLFQLSIGGNRSPFPVAPTPGASGNVTVHADASVITPLLQNSVQQIDLPANGSVSNVQVQFTNSEQMNITGDYQLSILGVPVTQPFTLNAQLVVENCQLQIHVLQANFSNISVAGLVALFEDKINQKLAQLVPQNNLPGNIELCLINLATDPQGINATFYLVIPSSPTPTVNINKPTALL